jgi:hypothetical protein
MLDVSLAAAALAASLGVAGGPAQTAFTFLQDMSGPAVPVPFLFTPLSPLDEILLCDADRMAFRAGDAGADAPFDSAGEALHSGSGIAAAYESADGWRCEVEQVVRDGRPSLEIRIVSPPAGR